MISLFKKKKHDQDLYLGTGRIIKIYDEYSSVDLPYPEDYNLVADSIKGISFTCLKSYDNISIFIPRLIFEDEGYSLFDKYAIQDTNDKRYLINISKFVSDYKIFSDIKCKTSDTIVPSYIDINKFYTCKKNNTFICINMVEHLEKTDSLYEDLSQIRQIKERLHIK